MKARWNRWEAPSSGSRRRVAIRRWAVAGVFATLLMSGAAAAQPSEDCAPACRKGFLCNKGTCVSACNPPCVAGETCTSAHECVAGTGKAATAPNAPVDTPPDNPATTGSSENEGALRASPALADAPRGKDPKRARFSVGRFFLESLVGGLAGSLAAYGTYSSICDKNPCLGGALAGLGADFVVTPIAVWGLGELTGGDGSLSYTFLGAAVAFSGASAGTQDPLLPLTIGIILMPFTSALMYELSSHIKASAQLGPVASIRPQIAPLFTPRGGALAGGTAGLGGVF
jgi:hypothetical protein